MPGPPQFTIHQDTSIKKGLWQGGNLQKHQTTGGRGTRVRENPNRFKKITK